jgi:hypothetical protein
MNQTNHFFDLGYGWLCKHCSAEDTERKQRPEVSAGFVGPSDRRMNESRTSELALARWTDSTHHALSCPRCGIEEIITNA